MESESLIGIENNSDGDENGDEIIDGDGEETKVRASRGPSKKYYHEATYDSIKLAEESLVEEQTWTKTGQKLEKKTQSKKIFYRCNKVTTRNKKQCSTGIVIILPSTNTTAEVHRTLCAHDHIPRQFSVSLEARTEIDKMFTVTTQLTPANILLNLQTINDMRVLQAKTEIVLPKERPLYNYLATYRKKAFGRSNMTLGELG